LTGKGVKPICSFRQDFEYTYLYGAFSPKTGDDFVLEFSECDTDCFQIFLDQFAQRKPDEYHVIVLDNAAFHKTDKLKIPPNIRLYYLPPYSPELNPAEKVWAGFKRAFTNKLFDSLDSMRAFIDDLVTSLNPEVIMSVCRCKYSEDDLYAK
jgi:transposase